MTGGTLRLHHVSLSTSDLPRAIAFYRDALGGEVVHEFRNESGKLYGVFIHCGNGSFMELFHDAAAPSASSSRVRHISFEVADIEAAAVHMRELGYAPTVRRGRTDKVLQFFIHDPDGNEVELQQHDDQSALTQFLNQRTAKP